MNKYIKTLMLIAILPIVVIPSYSQAEIKNISSAINKAGRQRMLSQRIVAAYCQVGMDISRKDSHQQLNKAINLFDVQLAELKAFRTGGKIGNQLEKVDQLWKPMKNTASGEVQRDKAAELRDMAEEVLNASHRVVILLQDESDSKTGRLVNVSGRQRMLSQRMSSLYMLQSWGFKNPRYREDYYQAMNEFKGALAELMSSSYNNKKINKDLNRARKQFSILEKSLRQKDGDFIPLLVKKSAEKLLFIMNGVTLEYEKLAAEQD